MPKKLLFITALCCALNACNGNDYDGIEVIVVSRTPGGAYAEENSQSKSRGIGWYDRGLSRNGEEPVEYIWSAGMGRGSEAIRNAEIGEKGTINLYRYTKKDKTKLPPPNATNPPVIGLFGEVYWERRE